MSCAARCLLCSAQLPVPDGRLTEAVLVALARHLQSHPSVALQDGAGAGDVLQRFILVEPERP